MRTLRDLALALAFVGALAVIVQAADVAGEWTGQFSIGQMKSIQHPFGITLKPDAGKLTGRFCTQNCGTVDGGIDIENGKIDGDTISFTIETGESALPQMDWQGQVTGDTIKFIISGKPAECGGSECQIGEATAARKGN